MPTRQATPGASTVLQDADPNASTKKKRGAPDGDGPTESPRDPKKFKTDPSSSATAGSRGGDRKKRRKRKRKVSIVGLAQDASRPPSRSKSTPVKTPVPEMPLTQEEEEEEAPVGEEAEARVDDPVEEADPGDSTASTDKGKGKAKEEPEESGQPASSSSENESQTAQIARLTEELRAQTALVQRHQSHLTQLHQSLTCQICLDLLHKPFALAPCGHIACHDCLIRWFTNNGEGGADAGPRNGTHIYKKKTCPICRAVVLERPVEVWGVKSMVSHTVRSGLVELPAPAPPPETSAAGSANADAWHNIFRPARRHNIFDAFGPAPPVNNNINNNNNNGRGGGGGGGLEDLGMYDAEDGGIYRCIDCMHEIWGRMCSNCQRIYPGHQAEDEGEDDDDEDRFDEESLVDDGLDFGPHGAMLADLIHMVRGGGMAWGGGGGGESDLDEEDLDGVIGDEEEEDEEDGDGPLEWGREARRNFVRRMYGEPAVFADFTDDEEDGIAEVQEVNSEDEGEGDDVEGTDGHRSEDEDVYDNSFIDDGDAGDGGDAGFIDDGEVIDLAEEDDAEDAPPARTGRGRRGRVDEIVISDEEEDEEDTRPRRAAAAAGRQFRLGRGPVLVIESSDEDE